MVLWNGNERGNSINSAMLRAYQRTAVLVLYRLCNSAYCNVSLDSGKEGVIGKNLACLIFSRYGAARDIFAHRLLIG